MADIFIPTLHTFAMKNPFTGSCGMLRFRIVPKVVKVEGNNKEVDFENSNMLAELWHGIYCYEICYYHRSSVKLIRKVSIFVENG